MKRYPSIDFLRGFAIFLMVVIHTFMRWFDRNAFIDKIGTGEAPLSLLLLMIILLFFGSFAGLFLMVSAIGNMISMFKGLQKGQDVKTLVMKQVIGGILLLVFAYLAEGIIGYKGAIGDVLIGSPQGGWDLIFHRGYHMETIHAVAWCVILNGIVQGLLSMNGGWKKIDRNIKIYAILAIIVVVVTQFVWWGFDLIVSDGDFSHGTDPATGLPWQRGNWLLLDPFTNILRIFWQPWAGEVEPLFPFLAVSFIGSMIGLYLMKREQEPENKGTKTLKIGMTIGFIMSIAGLIGVIIGILTIAGDPFDNILGILIVAYDVTAIEGNFGFLWVSYFIMITGAQIGLVLLIFRLVEFRGRAEPFAKKTLFFRRFGFVAFSIYTFQFIDIIVVYLFCLLPGFPAYGNYIFNEVQIWFVLVGILILWYVILSLWEKVNYAFGMEWTIAKLSEVLIPSKRIVTEGKLPWWKTRRLDPQASLHNAEWIEIISTSDINHEILKESKFAFKIALCGFIFPPCFPLSISLAKSSAMMEQENKYNKRAKLIGSIFTALILTVLIAFSFLTTAILF